MRGYYQRRRGPQGGVANPQRLIALLALTLVTSYGFPAVADEVFVNGEMLYKLCASQQKLANAPAHELVNPESAYEAYECRFYVAGVADAMAAMTLYKTCIPKSAHLDDLTKNVFAFLQRNPQYGNQSGFKVTLSAIISAYQCRPEK